MASYTFRLRTHIVEEKVFHDLPPSFKFRQIHLDKNVFKYIAFQIQKAHASKS